MSKPVTGLDALTGRVVRPGDNDYLAAGASWNQLFAHRPAVVVFACETADVVHALSYARRNGLPVRVRSGRHCLEGWSAVDDGVVIDVSDMKSVAIDTASGLATVGAGLKQLEAVTGLGAAGLAAPTGTEGTVGLMGATLGGGVGLLTRSFGMASDALVGAEIVVASGIDDAEVITVDATNHADLLWALRGAGNGNFGIVTSATYAVRPLAHPVYITARWPGLEHLPAVFDAWQRSAAHTDPRLTSQLEIKRDDVMLIGVFTSGSESQALQLLEPVLSIAAPEVSTRAASWPEIYTDFQIPIENEPAYWKFQSQFIYEPFPPEAIQAIASYMATAPTPQCNYFTNAMRGAVSDNEPPEGTAFAHRNALFYAEPGAGWGARPAGPPNPDDPLTKTCLQWIADFAKALLPYTNGAYVNVPNAGAPDWEHQYWGANVDRLRDIKAKYDPRNVFRFDQSLGLPPGQP